MPSPPVRWRLVEEKARNGRTQWPPRWCSVRLADARMNHRPHEQTVRLKLAPAATRPFRRCVLDVAHSTASVCVP